MPRTSVSWGKSKLADLLATTLARELWREIGTPPESLRAERDRIRKPKFDEKVFADFDLASLWPSTS